MTYRTKVFTLLISLVIISNGLLAGANYLECKSTLEMEIHRKSRSIAATAAALLDPELVIVVSKHTYSAVRPLFRWKSAGEITLRGRSEPVRAYTVEV